MKTKVFCWLAMIAWCASPALGQDCNANGIPDSCDVDCGMIGGPCDVPGCGLSSDCNANGIPDECEFVAPVLFVDKSAIGANDGSRWVDAFTDLQTALCVVEGNPGVITQIWVAAETYTPTGPGGDRSATFQLINGVGVYGGFAGTETLFSERDPIANVTTLSGDLNGDDVPVADPVNLLTEPTRAENSYHVVTGSLTNATAILDGFTLSGGNANDVFPGDSGGGMFNENSSPTVNGCIFTANAAATIGGGMLNFANSSPSLTNCTFSGNRADVGGGGMDNESSNPIVTGCIFTANTSAVDGGGLRNTASSPTVSDCTFTGNISFNGAGMFNWSGSNPDVTNCTFTTNNAANNGGGMANFNLGNPAVTDCVFSGNSAAYGAGMHNFIDSSPNLTACIFTTNVAAVVGGGMANFAASSPLATNCTFGSNTAADGGGMFNSDNSNPTVTDCTFSSNTADNSGGGMFNGLSSSPNITNCMFMGNSAIAFGGGGMNNDNNSSPTVANCTFDGNTADFGGGMDNFSSSSPQVTGCTFAGNQASHGAGIFNIGGSAPTVTNCLFTANIASSVDNQGRGGGMNNESSNPIITGCIFTLNTSEVDGGGLRNAASSPMVTNCTFTGNESGGGAGMFNWAGSNPTVAGCAFDTNMATVNGGGMLNAFDSSPIVGDCTFTANTAGNSGGGIHNVNSSPAVNGCTFSGNSANFSAGLGNNNSSPTVTNCTFSGNTATNAGGGMNNFTSSPAVTGCAFSGNSATVGGGMHNNSSSPVVSDCTFSGNSANFGAGINNVANSIPTVINCTFSGNTAANTGGGMNNFNNSTPTVTNCTFSGNTAGNNGGAMRSHLNSIATVTSCTFTANTAVNNGGGIWNNENGTSVIANSIFWDNTDTGGANMDESAQISSDATSSATVDYSDIQGLTGTLGGLGNLELDPLFVDADGPDNVPGTADDNLRLMFGSPAIDAADNTAVPPDTADLDGDGDTIEPTPVDLDGNQRFLDDPFTGDIGNPGFGLPVVDMGAFEFVSDCNQNGIPDGQDVGNQTSTDCNANGIPDECEIDVNSPAPGGPFFCTMNCDRDCNDNGIPDACDIAGCPAGDPSCGDCNNNGVPDGCDIASGSSTDVIDNMTGLPGSDGIPDECITWSGGAPDTLWSNTANWEAGTVPGIGDPASVESPVIGLAGTLVDLDVDASVDSLVLGMGITLNINGGNLTLDSPNGLRNDGSLIVADGHSIIASTPAMASTLLTGSQPIQLAGATASISSGAVGTITNIGSITGRGIIDADFVNSASGSVVALTSGILHIAGTMPKVNDGLMKALDGGTLQIDTGIIGIGSYLADGGTIDIRANIIENPPGSNVAFTAQGGSIQVGMGAPSVSIDGCGPVIVIPRTGTPNQSGSISADNAFVMNASSWTIGDMQMGMGLTATMSLMNNSVGLVNGPVTVRLNGTLVISNSSLTAVDLIIEDGGTLAIGSSVTLSGSFTHDATDGTSVSWATGSMLTFEGGQMASLASCTLNGWATFETASADTGPMGGAGDFAFADIVLADGAHVSLVDLAANSATAVEAVYCDSLMLGAGAVLNLNGLNMYVSGVPLISGPTGIGTITNETRVAGGGLLGDTNGDGVFNIADLAGFVDVLLGIDTDPVHACSADMNTDGTADGGDIQAFVEVIVLP